MPPCRSVGVGNRTLVAGGPAAIVVRPVGSTTYMIGTPLRWSGSPIIFSGPGTPRRVRAPADRTGPLVGRLPRRF